MDTVQQLRQQIIRQRKALTADEITHSSAQMATCLGQSEIFQQARHIAFYLPVSGEADPTSLLGSSGKICYLPVLKDANEGGLHFVRADKNSPFITNKFGISEPILTDENQILAQLLDLVIMPLVGFDQTGNRIGMGGGYYDRSFAFKQSLPTSKPLLIGYAYGFQQMENLKPAAWDVKMDGVVTEKGLFRF